jgi:hypothetical protein
LGLGRSAFLRLWLLGKAGARHQNHSQCKSQDTADGSFRLHFLLLENRGSEKLFHEAIKFKTAPNPNIEWRSIIDSLEL